MNHAYLGVNYKNDDVNAATNRKVVRLQAISRRSDNICRETAQLLSEGHVFGWFQGRSEFGPRALGSRSILADPRTAEMKDKLNKRVKHRQAFRPFAPIVLAERAKEIFEGDEESPFMLLAKGVRREWRDRNPGGRSRRRHGARADGSASTMSGCTRYSANSHRSPGFPCC